MDSKANATRKEDQGFTEDVEAAERATEGAGVHNTEGAAGDTKTPRLLPVPTLVEPFAPSIPEVEPFNKHSPRVASGLTTGQQTNKPTQTKVFPPLGAKGNAAKIYPAEGPRGKSLPKFGQTTGDAQEFAQQHEFMNTCDSSDGVVKHGGTSDQIFTPQSSPFSADASKITHHAEERKVHSVTIKINDAQEIMLKYAHPGNDKDVYKMTKDEDFRLTWSPQMSAYFDANYVKDEVTKLVVDKFTFSIAGREKSVSQRQEKLIKRRNGFEALLGIARDDVDKNANAPSVQEWLILRAHKMVIYHFIVGLAQQEEETIIMTVDEVQSDNILQQIPELTVAAEIGPDEWNTERNSKLASGGTDRQNAVCQDATSLYVALQRKGGIQGLLNPAMAAFYEKNGTSFSDSIIANRWNLVLKDGELNDALTLPEVIEFVMYGYLIANQQQVSQAREQQLSQRQEVQELLKRTEMLRQLLLKVDEHLCTHGWLEKFDYMCENSSKVVEEVKTLPVKALTFQPLKEVANVLLELYKRLHSSTQLFSNVDDQVSQHYLADSPSLMELSRELHTYRNPAEARDAQLRQLHKQSTEELNPKDAKCSPPVSDDESECRRDDWIKKHLSESPTFEVAHTKAQLAESMNSSQSGWLPPRQVRIDCHNKGLPITQLVCQKVSKAPLTIKCSCCVNNIVDVDDVNLCPRCQAPHHSKCLDNTELNEINEHCGYEVKRCFMCIMDMLLESTEKLNEEETLRQRHQIDRHLELGLQHNVQVMGMLQRYKNEGLDGIKNIEFDANGNYDDDTYSGTEESVDQESLDGSFDLDQKDSTHDRNICAAQQYGLGIIPMKEGLDFNESMFKRHVKVSKKVNRQLEEEQIARESREKAARDRELARTQQIIRDVAAKRDRIADRDERRKALEAQDALLEEAIEEAMRNKQLERIRVEKVTKATKVLRKLLTPMMGLWLHRRTLKRQKIRLKLSFVMLKLHMRARQCVKLAFGALMQYWLKCKRQSEKAIMVIDGEVEHHPPVRKKHRQKSNPAEPKLPPEIKRSKTMRVLASRKHAQPPLQDELSKLSDDGYAAEPRDEGTSYSSYEELTDDGRQSEEKAPSDPSDDGDSDDTDESSDDPGGGGGPGDPGDGDSSPSDDSTDTSSEDDTDDELNELFDKFGMAISKKLLSDFTEKLLKLWIWGLDRKNFDDQRLWNNSTHYTTQVNKVSTQCRKLIWETYCIYSDLEEDRLDTCPWVNTDGTQLYQTSRMIRHVFACSTGVKHHLSKYIGRTYKELGKTTFNNAKFYSRKDVKKIVEDDIPYINCAMHTLISHYIDQFEVDEFDLEAYAESDNGKKKKAPTARVGCFKWTAATFKPIFCANAQADMCRGWYCIRNAYRNGQKHKYCKYCLENDSNLYEEALSESTSVAGTSTARSQTKSDSTAGDNESVASANVPFQPSASMSSHNKLETELAALDELQRSLNPDQLLQHVLKGYGGCPNGTTCVACDQECLKAAIVEAVLNTGNSQGAYDADSNDNSFSEYESHYVSMAVLYRTLLYVNLKSPFVSGDCEDLNRNDIYPLFRNSEVALWLIDAMSNHQHYTEAEARYRQGPRSTIAPDSTTKYVFSKIGTPHVSFRNTLGGGRTPGVNATNRTGVPNSNSLIGLSRENRTQTAQGQRGTKMLMHGLATDYLRVLNDDHKWENVAGSGGCYTDEFGEQAHYNRHWTHGIPCAVYSYKTQALEAQVTKICKEITDKNLQIPLDRGEKAEWDSKMTEHWRKWPIEVKLLIPMTRERLSKMLIEAEQEKDASDSGSVHTESSQTGQTISKYLYCFQKGRHLNEWVVKTRPFIDKILKALMKKTWQSSSNRALTNFLEQTQTTANGLSSNDDIFRITDQFVKAMRDVKEASKSVNTAGQADKERMIQEFTAWKLVWTRNSQLMDQMMNLFKIVSQLCSLGWSNQKFAGEKMYNKVMKQVHADIKSNVVDIAISGRSTQDTHRKLYFEHLQKHVDEIESQNKKRGPDEDGQSDGWGMMNCATINGDIVAVKVNFVERMFLEFARFQEDPKQVEWKQTAWSRKDNTYSPKKDSPKSEGSKVNTDGNADGKSKTRKQTLADKRDALNKAVKGVKRPKKGRGKETWGGWMYAKARINSVEGAGPQPQLTDRMMTQDELDSEYVYGVNLLASHGIQGFESTRPDITEEDIKKLRDQYGDLGNVCTKCLKTGHMKRDCTTELKFANDEAREAHANKARIIYTEMKNRRQRTLNEYVKYGKSQMSPTREGGKGSGKGRGKGKGKGRGKGKGKGKGKGETYHTQALSSPSEYVQSATASRIDDAEAKALIGKTAYNSADYVEKAQALVQRMKEHFPDALRAIQNQNIKPPPSVLKPWMMWIFPTDYVSLNETRPPQSCVHHTTKGLVLQNAPKEWELLLTKICEMAHKDSSIFGSEDLPRIRAFCGWWGERREPSEDTPQWLMNLIGQLEALYPGASYRTEIHPTNPSCGSGADANIDQAQLTEGKFRTVKIKELPSIEETDGNKSEWFKISDKTQAACDEKNRNGGNGTKYDYHESDHEVKHTAKPKKVVQDNSSFLDSRVEELSTNMFCYLAESDSEEEVERVDTRTVFQARWANDLPSHDSIEVFARPATPTGPLQSYPNSVLNYNIGKFRVHKYTTVQQLRDELKSRIQAHIHRTIEGHIYVHIVPSGNAGKRNCYAFGDGRGSVYNDKECMPEGTTLITVETAIPEGSQGGMPPKPRIGRRTAPAMSCGGSNTEQNSQTVQPTVDNAQSDQQTSEGGDGGNSEANIGNENSKSNDQDDEAESNTNERPRSRSRDRRRRSRSRSRSQRRSRSRDRQRRARSRSLSSSRSSSQSEYSPTLRNRSQSSQRSVTHFTSHPDHFQTSAGRGGGDGGGYYSHGGKGHGSYQHQFQSGEGKGMDNRDRWHYSPQNRQQYPSPYPYQGKGGAPPPPPPEHYPRPEAPLGQLRLDSAYVPLDIMLTIPPYREDNSTRQYMFFLHNTVAVNVSLQVDKHRQQHTFLQCEHGYTAAFNAALDEVFRVRGYSFIKQCQFKKVPLLEQMRGKPLIGPVLIDKKWGKKNIEGNSVKQCSLEIGTIKVLDKNHSSKSRPKQTNQPHSKAIQMAKGNIVDSCTPEYVDSYHCYSSGENCGKGIFYYWNERKRLAEIKLMTTPIPAETYHHRIVSLERELISLQVQLQKQDEALDTIALSMTLGSGQTVLTINLLSLLTHDFMTTMNRTGLNSNVPFTYKPQLGSHVQDTDCVVTKCTDEIYKLISETFEAATDVPHPKRINATSYRNDLSRHLKPETLKAIIKQLILQNSVFDDVTPFVVQRSLRVFKTADDEGTSDEPNFSMSEIDSNVDLVEKYLSTQSKAKFSPGNMKMHRDGGHVEQGDLSYAQLDLSSTWNAVDQTLDDFEELKGRYPSSLCVTVVSAALLASQLKMTGNLPGVQTATKGIKSTFFGSTFQHLTKVSTTDGHNFLTHLLRTISMIEDQENSASCVSATIKFDLLNEDYSNWSREKINEASTIVDEWIQRRAYMSDVLASNLDKLSRHLEDLQHEYVTTTDSRTKDRYADVDWKSVQNRLLSANHALIKHLQSAGQTFLGHASSEYLETKWKQASDCRRKKDELQSIHARSLTDLTSEMESDTTQGENDLGEGTTSTSSTQDEENEQKSPIINAWHSQTNEQQADINREAYDYGLSRSYGRYACQFSSMQVLRTLETMIRSIMWNWSNSSFANINVGNLARTTDRTYDPVVTFANSQARDEIRRLLDMYMSCHKDYAALLERSHKSKHYPRSTVGEARGCYQQESRREDNHRYPRALNDGHALGAHEGSLRTFVYNLADDFARKVLLQTEGHNVKVITDPRPFGLLKDRTQLHCGSKSNQFVTSTIVQGSTVYVKISDHTEIHMVKQLGNEKFYVPEKVLDPFRYVKTYYVLPGVGRDHKDNDFCGKVNGFLAQRKQHELAERVMFSPAWRETSINEVMGHPMLPSALALTNGELCNKLVRGVHSFVTDTGPWETMFRLGFPV